MTLIQNWIDSVCDKLFSRIRDEQKGEIEEDTWFEDANVGDILHEEIDYAVTNDSLGEVEDAVRTYGINRAISLYISEHGAEAFGNITGDYGQYSRCLLYIIIRDTMELPSYTAYIQWCEKN